MSLLKQAMTVAADKTIDVSPYAPPECDFRITLPSGQFRMSWPKHLSDSEYAALCECVDQAKTLMALAAEPEKLKK